MALDTDKTYWENTVPGYNKFWACQILEKKRKVLVGNLAIHKTFYILVRKWGKIGTNGQSMEQVFNSKEEAMKMRITLISDKHKKGYSPIF